MCIYNYKLYILVVNFFYNFILIYFSKYIISSKTPTKIKLENKYVLNTSF